MRRKFLSLVLVGASVLGNVSPGAHAQTAYPNKPVRIVVPYGAGGSVDTVARIMGTAVSGSLGQPIIVDNRPGAGGAIGGAELARSAPDGYTLLADQLGTLTIGALTNKHLAYDPWKDFIPVATVAQQPLFLAVRSTLPAKNVSELIALAKAKPGSLSFGSAGRGTESHLVMELFKVAGGVDMVHIPYKGGALAVFDLQAGRIDVIAITWTALRAAIERNQVRVIATLSPKRVAAMATVPTVAEAGYPAMSHVPITVLFAPAKTPNAIVSHWSEALKKSKGDKALLSWAESTGSELAISDSRKLSELIQSELKKWKPITEKLDLSE